ncbi:MAG TPA: hypothetical protein VGF07_11310 [Stellaceae bacterium]
MSRPGTVAALIAAAALAGCSALDPYATYPRQPAAGVVDPGPRVAVCYDTLVSTTKAVEQTAQEECPAHTRATRIDTDWLLLNCPLLLPARATFVCAPEK